MAVPRFVRYAGQGYVGQYIHLGGKIGVQVEFAGVDAGGRGARGVHDAGQGNRDADRGGQPAAATCRATRCRPTRSRRRRRSTARRWRTPASRPTSSTRSSRASWEAIYSQVVLPDQPSIRDPKMTVTDVIAAAQQGARRAGRRSPLRPAEGRRDESTAELSRPRPDPEP